jgi:GABA permease
VRSPFHSEPEAFHFLLLLTAVLVPIAIAVAIGLTWLALTLIAVALAALAVRRVQMRMVKRHSPELELKSAPAHVGGAQERRILLVANDTLNDEAFIREVARQASMPNAHVFILAPALISAGARLTGDIDHELDQARGRLEEALGRIPYELTAAGEISDAEPLEAIEDAVATFTPDQIIISTRRERSSRGLDPRLADLARQRFALPVGHLALEAALSAS